MTIKLPVRVETDENESSWWVADADGEPVDLYAIVAALNAPAAPDLTALREAVEEYRDVEARKGREQLPPNAQIHAFFAVANAALALFSKDGDA